MFNWVWVSFSLNDWFLKVYINFSPTPVIRKLQRFINFFSSKILTSLPISYAWKFNLTWLINYTKARGLTHTHFSSREMVLNVKNRRHPIKQLIKIYRFLEFINLFAAKNYIQKKWDSLWKKLKKSTNLDSHGKLIFPLAYSAFFVTKYTCARKLKT